MEKCRKLFSENFLYQLTLSPSLLDDVVEVKSLLKLYTFHITFINIYTLSQCALHNSESLQVMCCIIIP